MTRIRTVVACCGFLVLGLAPFAPQALGPSPAVASSKCKFCVSVDLVIVGFKYCYEGPCNAEAPAMPHWIP